MDSGSGSTGSQPLRTLPPNVLLLHYEKFRPVATAQKASLPDVAEIARQFFALPANPQLKYFTKFVTDDLVQVDPGAWNMIFGSISELWIELDESPPRYAPAPRKLCRKPVIYLYPATPISINVRLSLTSSWQFSAIYPLVPIKRSGSIAQSTGGETAFWDVLATPDGTLRLPGGLEVSYLYWEAETRAPRETVTPPASRPATPELDLSTDRFDPTNPILTPQNAVLLAVPTDVTKYLDQALLAMGLHTEARTSFITYWLPSLVKHEQIALRFVEQSSYEAAARLSITPKPDVVTRVFMLFRGVDCCEVADWTEAEERAKNMDVAAWRNIVGVDWEKMQFRELFRVLEWGGMEVGR
ncbi:hypothetical protein APHAL10511_003004 [Amanita phalloides]|nr:hypothetical protein APHAL10511_003004 [Amanita phalloides]